MIESPLENERPLLEPGPQKMEFVVLTFAGRIDFSLEKTGFHGPACNPWANSTQIQLIAFHGNTPLSCQRNLPTTCFPISLTLVYLVITSGI